MKKYLSKIGLPLIALFASAVGYGQKLTIDQINSDSTALRYVREANYDAHRAPQWKFFYLTSGDEWQSYFNFSNTQIETLRQQVEAKNWFKTDLNGDGKTDLVVSGYIAKKPGDWATATFKILVYLSQDAKSYAGLNLLSVGSDQYPAYVNELQLNGKNCLQLNRWQIQEAASSRPFQSDTISYSAYWENFVNFHEQGMRKQDIKTISYKVMEDTEGSYHALNIDLASTKKTNMEVVVKNAKEKEPEINKVRLAKELWSRMDTLIRSSYVTGKLKGDTTVVAHEMNSEQLPIYLSVTYMDGHTQTIQDYGIGSTYSYMTIYTCMENIIQNIFDQLQRRQEMMSSVINGALDGGFSF